MRGTGICAWLRASGLRRWTQLAMFGSAAIALTACAGLSGAGFPTANNEPPTRVGNGEVTVALLLPTSAAGNAGRIAQGMQNAAELAMSEMPAADIALVPFDSRGTAEGAQAAARRAVGEEADLIIGPLFATEVQAAGSAARDAGTPMIAFSTDANVARSGVYLLSFLPEAEVERVVGYATRNGKRSFAALLPQNNYGALIDGAFQQAVSRNNGRVVAIERYDSGREGMQAAVSRIASVAGGSSPQVDALLVPDAPEILGPMLAAADVDTAQVQILGSGQWNDETAWETAELEGSWFAGPDPSGWQRFRSRFRDTYGAAPPRNATLAYDAVSLAAALARIEGPDAFTAATLTSPDGFAGIDGVFRFRSTGASQRGLAILEIKDGAAKVREPGPRHLGVEG